MVEAVEVVEEMLERVNFIERRLRFLCLLHFFLLLKLLPFGWIPLTALN